MRVPKSTGNILCTAGSLIVLFLFTGCFWGSVDVTLLQRTQGVVEMDLYVPYLLRGFSVSGGPLLPFPSEEDDFRQELALLRDVTVNSLSFENASAGWHISGSLRYSSIEGLIALGEFLTGEDIENQWETESTINVTVPARPLVLEDSPVLSYYQNLFTQNSLLLRFTGSVDTARVENGTRDEEGRVIFEFIPSELLENPQIISIGW